MAASMSGEQIQALVNQLEPISPTGLGRAVEVVAILLGVVCTVVVSLRVYVRAGLSGASTRIWGVEDYLALIGTLPFLPSVVFAVYAARYGVGSHDVALPSQLYLIQATEYVIYWEILYFISSTIIKCAIGFTCIRLDRRKQIVIPISVNMAIMVTVAILALVFVFVNCTPLAATWNPLLQTISLQTVSYIVSAIQMVTDWVCAGVPFVIVAGLQMSRRKKVSVICILGLGIFASVATCVRMPYLKYYDTTKYPTEIAYHLGVINITSNIECGLGIIGCSLPPLRKLFRFYYGSSHDANYKYPRESENGLGGSGRGIKLGSMNGSNGAYHASARRAHSGATELELEDDDSSRRGIMRKTEVHVSSESSPFRA
ncbi:hypothetical protein DHEL01_v208833 [Diaporthe helianthi]|uniref:Rhodopsin domain-containing protein n=1 Tax=Diaporthe helianthi TaxID=158607 RepID=A0A2P5HR95_DIAHE|nr:hypothetical protein DHEL01_v208833 [Diaporthe helianthi]